METAAEREITQLLIKEEPWVNGTDQGFSPESLEMPFSLSTDSGKSVVPPKASLRACSMDKMEINLVVV